jgi:predicted pyridoxine 5'-phosphate oxidase superfamily flavin-nucleotide-binding protein
MLTGSWNNMSQRFADIAFTPGVKAVQTALGSRDTYARRQQHDAPGEALTDDEVEFLSQRDSFYLASVSETGWPYVQHRGGPPGFLKVIDSTTIGFADFRGNRQYVSVGNITHDDRVALILMDYPNRLRLKILGHARFVSEDEPALLAQLQSASYRARAERGIVVRVAAFDWNCPQHITPRFSATEVESQVAPLRARIAELEAQLRASMKV